MKRNQNPFPIILFGLCLLALLAMWYSWVRQHAAIGQEVSAAFRSTNQQWIVTADGTNILVGLKDNAVPVLLDWSRGRDPSWYPWVNPVREFLKMPRLESTWFWKGQDARKGFAILGDHATSAVPTLVQRLSHPDPNVRRMSVHMLGAIGPSIGSQAFQQLTNCLTDPEKDVRNDVVWSIQFHRPEAYPVESLLAIYKAGLADPYFVAKENAQIGLNRLAEGPNPPQQVIEQFKNDSDPSVRKVAEQWLSRQQE